MLMGSCLAMTVALAVVSATTAAYKHGGSKGASSASIAFIYIFGVSFAIGFTPMQPIYPAEVLSSGCFRVECIERLLQTTCERTE
jgi:hypothetical protein